MEFLPAIQMAALVFVVINFLKAVKNKDGNAALTQIVVWVAGIVVVLLYAQTVWADSIMIGDQPLSALNFASLIAVGLAISSLASAANELRKAFDNGDSSAQPPLFK